MPPIYVTGHRNPDTDSIAAAVGYAELKGRLDPNNEYVGVRLGECNPQTRWVLERSGVSEPPLLPHVMLRAGDVMQSSFPVTRHDDPVREAGLAMARAELELVPVLHMALDGQVPVYFEHHVLLWKYPALQIGLHPLRKGLKRRVFGGMPLLLLEAQSAGEIAFSRDAPGHIAALHLPAGHGIVVREHQFLAATAGVQYDYSRIKGFANMLYGGGFFVDEFFAGDHEGVVWVHGYGNVFEKQLEPGETIDIEPGGWVYRDHSVTMNQEVYGFKTGFLGGGGNLVFNRFTGPGRVGLQSAYFHPPVQEGAGGNSQRGEGGLGSIIGGLLDN